MPGLEGLEQVMPRTVRVTREVVYALVCATLVGMVWTAPSQPVPSAASSDHYDQVSEMVRHHQCWTEAGPSGVIPSRVLYRDADGRPALDEAGPALDWRFGNGKEWDTSRSIVAFCR